MWLICRIYLSARGTEPFTAGFWADKDVPDKRRRKLDAKDSTGLIKSLRSGDRSVFQPGDCFLCRGWKAGTIVLMTGLKQAHECVDDVCAVKHHT